MSAHSPDELLDGVLAIGRHSGWTLQSLTPLRGDVGHPQGLTVRNDSWLMTTVHPTTRRGLVCTYDRSGHRVHELDVTDGNRIHPGGVDFGAGSAGVWIAVAEYRPLSTSTVIRIDEHDEVTARFTVDDHLGAVCDLDDGTLLAVSWGSRQIYRLGYDGDIVERLDNPSHMIDYQDLQVVSPGYVLASGVAQLAFGDTQLQLGGFAVIDVSDLHVVHEVPITAVMPSGRSITYNGFHVEMRDGKIVVDCLVDDTTAAIGHWTVA